MGMIKGTNVVLKDATFQGLDPFGSPVYTTTEVTVSNVLVAQPTTDDITTAQDLYGKKLVYTLGIPKGDTHVWEDREVAFFGHTYRTFGAVIQGIEENIPLEWHKKVMVERYE